MQEKFCGKKTNTTTTKTPTVSNVPVPTPRPTQDGEAAPANSCKTKYDELIEKCEMSTSDTAASCDESNHAKMKNASNNAQTAAQSDTAAVQQACGQAGGISNSAKEAMKTFRENCGGALETCQSACGELSEFLRQDSCWSTLGLNQNSAKVLADSKKRSCDTYQSQVDDADQAISNYNTTGAGSAACQMAAMGTSSPEEAAKENEKKTFCEANPTYPGCASASAANCDDPSQANNKVCVCSKNPGHYMCRGGMNAESDAFASSSIDASSRLPTSQASANAGDMPSLPGLEHGPRPKGGDVQGIDGRQGGAAVGSANLSGNVNPSGIGGGGGGPADVVPGSGGSYGGGGSGGRALMGASLSGSGGGGRGGGSGSANGAVNQNPDLRQFLPGGSRDPRLQGNAGSTGVDGITGPHSNIWGKVRNRYQLLKNTLEP
ncbi:hypothetical protein AZI86_09070 [Bdellovibrio bacteriovorus]|uniref:Uncharacterized protein n=2 Tax=Bdellovibrio bacteriovorus TaxID=959 RepID=A0A150WRR5_BDEBC|nr:hypothetical protein AZI86_09070 [Bdellovibrio bacteriovorus]